MSDLRGPAKGKPWTGEDLALLGKRVSEIMFPDGRPKIKIIGEPPNNEQVLNDLAASLGESGGAYKIKITSVEVGGCSNCSGTFDDLLTPDLPAKVRDSQPPAGESPIGEQGSKDPA